MAISERLDPLRRDLAPAASPAPRPVAAAGPRPDQRRGWRRLAHAPLGAWHAIARRRWLMWTLGSIVVLLVAARIAAPFALRWYIDRTINAMPGYQGGVGDVTIHLWKGAYQVDDIMISQIGSPDLAPFLTCGEMDLAVQWAALMKGAVVGVIVLRHPVVNFAAAKNPQNQQTGGAKKPDPDQGATAPPDVSWQDQVKKMMPIAVNHIDVIDGKVRFQDVEKHVDIDIGRLEATVTNLTNSDKISAENSMVATVKAKGDTIGAGHFTISGDIDPFAANPTFAIKASLEHLNLPAINDFTKAYAKVTVERGTFDLYADITAKDGALSGYVKPMFTGLDVLNFKEDIKHETALKAFWEGIVGATGKILQNQPKDRLATEIPITGRVDQPGTNLMGVVAGVLKNAFVRALMPGFKDKGGPASVDAPKDPAKQQAHDQAERKLESNQSKAAQTK